jgi:hypothetical protein
MDGPARAISLCSNVDDVNAQTSKTQNVKRKVADDENAKRLIYSPKNSLLLAVLGFDFLMMHIS